MIVSYFKSDAEFLCVPNTAKTAQDNDYDSCVCCKIRPGRQMRTMFRVMFSINDIVDTVTTLSHLTIYTICHGFSKNINFRFGA